LLHEGLAVPEREYAAKAISFLAAFIPNNGKQLTAPATAAETACGFAHRRLRLVAIKTGTKKMRVTWHSAGYACLLTRQGQKINCV